MCGCVQGCRITPGGFAKCFAFCKTFRCTKSLKGLRTAKPPGDVTEARRDFVTSVLSYTQAGIFTTKLSHEELNFKFTTLLAYEARNPCLRIGDVIGSVFFFVRLFGGRFCRAVGQTHSLPSLGLSVCLCGLE